jgi:hypothetical protein
VGGPLLPEAHARIAQKAANLASALLFGAAHVGLAGPHDEGAPKDSDPPAQGGVDGPDAVGGGPLSRGVEACPERFGRGMSGVARPCKQNQGQDDRLDARFLHPDTLARTALTGGFRSVSLVVGLEGISPSKEPLLSKPQARNDIESAVPKFCFGLEVHRRTPDGRVRTAQEFLSHFFPHDKKSSTDRIFHYLPSDVRAPILTTWGVRGRKSALLDDDAKVQSVMHDALVAGDVDASMFEEALASDTIMRWIDLSDWWTFWRGGKITKYTILKALESGYELGLFDADWFLGSVRGNGGRLRGTDVLAEGLNKADLTEWVRRVHESGDGSPKGLLAALGWDQIVAKTADDVLVAVLDAMATKVSLAAVAEAKELVKPEPKSEEKIETKAEVKTDAKPEVKADAKPAEAKPEAKAEAKPDAKVDPKAITPPAKADVKVEAGALPKVEPTTAKSAGIVPPVGGVGPLTGIGATAPAAGGPAAGAAGAALPGLLIPSTAVAADKADDKIKPSDPDPEGNEEAIDSESAATLFKDDELIPISSGAWDEASEGAEAGGAGANGERPNRGSKPPQGKRASRTPPAPARGNK